MNNVNETYRLQAVQKFYELSENVREELQSLAELASEICNTPIALLSIVHKDKQYFLGKVGTEMTETARDISFCNYTIQQEAVLQIDDTWKDERFAHNPLVTGEPNIRFYAGSTITTDDGFNVGSICVIDHKPRQLTTHQERSLAILSKQATRLMELNLTLKFTSYLLENQENTEMKLRSILDSSSTLQILIGKNYELLAFNKAASRYIKQVTGRAYIPGENILNYATPSSLDIFKECYQKALSGEHIQAERQVSYHGAPVSWWEITYSPARDNSGDIIGVVFNALNIDDRKNKEEQIELQNSKLKAIAQLQSHQVRGPLTSIIGVIQIIKEENYQCDKEIIDLLEIAVQQLDDNIRSVVNKTTDL
jgi:PAS domain S-box-containing protein